MNAIATAPVAAGAILAVDFGRMTNGTASPLETSPSPSGLTWQPFTFEDSVQDASVDFSTTTEGTVTVAIDNSSGGTFRDRTNDGGYSDNPPAFTYAELLRDLATRFEKGETAETVTISGLTPNTPYDLRL